MSKYELLRDAWFTGKRVYVEYLAPKGWPDEKYTRLVEKETLLSIEGPIFCMDEKDIQVKSSRDGGHRFPLSFITSIKVLQ